MNPNKKQHTHLLRGYLSPIEELKTKIDMVKLRVKSSASILPHPEPAYHSLTLTLSGSAGSVPTSGLKNLSTEKKKKVVKNNPLE